MLSPWIIRTLTLPPLLASLVPRNFRRYHKPTIYLPQNSHDTYLLWHFHSHSEIYCHATSITIIYMTHSSFSYCLAWSCSWHSICGKATAHDSFILVTLDSLHIPVHRRRHSYRVISSCYFWVVNNRSMMIFLFRALSHVRKWKLWFPHKLGWVLGHYKNKRGQRIPPKK